MGRHGKEEEAACTHRSWRREAHRTGATWGQGERGDPWASVSVGVKGRGDFIGALEYCEVTVGEGRKSSGVGLVPGWLGLAYCLPSLFPHLGLLRAAGKLAYVIPGEPLQPGMSGGLGVSTHWV